ncbi:MAG: DUF4062 domain-containing protein [Coriobacteriales bacterium]|jgi:energy-coupling factor transporter ATP-binding protein EcfA2|nr:DUF4062 domain-containing protein [Coriobacteriales bacterium]
MFNKPVSIFVSSTFKDMQVERDLLLNKVLPQLNEWAENWKSSVDLIDLRWGVDTADISEEEMGVRVLGSCLDEIANSKPFFIGILGDRYGWIPDKAMMDAVLATAGKQLYNEPKSVTELEIDQGALHLLDPSTTLFFFREEVDYSGQPEDILGVYRDSEEGLARLNRLKREIEGRHDVCIERYHANFEHGELVPAGSWTSDVADAIWKMIVENAGWQRPPMFEPTPEVAEKDAQEAFEYRLKRAFAARRDTVDWLARYCLGETLPLPGNSTFSDDAVNNRPEQMLLLKGQPGSGKSSLVAAVASKIRAHDPETLVIPLYCGLTSFSSQLQGILKYGLEEMQAGCADFWYDATAVKSLSGTNTSFGYYLPLLAKEVKRVVIFLDGIDTLAAVEHDSFRAWASEPFLANSKLAWARKPFPDNLRVVITSSSDEEDDMVLHYGGRVISLDSFSLPVDELEEIVHQQGAIHHKQLPQKAVRELLDLRDDALGVPAQNPLFVSLIVQSFALMSRRELAVIDGYMAEGLSQPDALVRYLSEQMNDTIHPSLAGAYLYYLDRLGEQFGQLRMRWILGLIAASEHGIRLADIERILIRQRLSFEPYLLQRIKVVMGDHLRFSGKGKVIDFAHPILRSIIWANWTTDVFAINTAIVEFYQSIIGTMSPDFSALSEAQRGLFGQGFQEIVDAIGDDFATWALPWHLKIKEDYERAVATAEAEAAYDPRSEESIRALMEESVKVDKRQ